MTFYLGTHEPSWLKRTAHPLFISRRRLARIKHPRALAPTLGRWALDSGGFSELTLFGRWETSPKQYAAEVRRWRDEVGNLDWAAIQDWMCEPIVREKTGLSVREHQARTVESLATLTALAPDLPWAPVLQGWHPDDYIAHAEMYRNAGFDLAAYARVGVGTLCRRQATAEATDILMALRPLGLKLHGFGLKLGFLKLRIAHGLASSDSLAWSFHARKRPPLPGCRHASCANCFDYALRWSDAVKSYGYRPNQLMFL